MSSMTADAAHVRRRRCARYTSKATALCSLSSRACHTQSGRTLSWPASRWSSLRSSCSARIAVKCSSAHVTASCPRRESVRRAKSSRRRSCPRPAPRPPGRARAPCSLNARCALAVHRLLRDEGVDGRAQLRVLDVVPVASHRLDEEALALGKEQRSARSRTSSGAGRRGTSRAARRAGVEVEVDASPDQLSHADAVCVGAARATRLACAVCLVISGHHRRTPTPPRAAGRATPRARRALRPLGRPPPALLEGTGLTVEALKDPATRVPLPACASSSSARGGSRASLPWRSRWGCTCACRGMASSASRR